MTIFSLSLIASSKGMFYLGLLKILTLTPPEQAKNY